MGGRYWVWVVVRLAVGVAIVGWAASYLTTGSGEKEFQKTLDAMKQVHSFRVAFTANLPTQHNEMLWEVDCDRNVYHYQWHVVQTNSDTTSDMSRDEVHVATEEFDRESDGSWSKPRFTAGGRAARWYCGALAQGNDNGLMPRIATMIQRGILQKGDKKTVNGVRCREWLVTMKGAPGGLEHDTVCLGLEDHLPYEMKVDWQQSRSTFSDYNAAISFDMPESAVQPTSANTGSTEASHSEVRGNVRRTRIRRITIGSALMALGRPVAFTLI